MDLGGDCQVILWLGVMVQGFINPFADIARSNTNRNDKNTTDCGGSNDEMIIIFLIT